MSRDPVHGALKDLMSSMCALRDESGKLRRDLQALEKDLEALVAYLQLPWWKRLLAPRKVKR